MAITENRRPSGTGRAPAGAAVLRDEVTTAIRGAVMKELADVGYGRLSIEAVARRAGVGKTAIYRRWPSKLDMVIEIVSAIAGQRLPLPDTGTLRDDLRVLLQALALGLRHPLASQIIPDLLAEAARTPQIAETLLDTLRTHQRDIAARIVGRAVERGELPAAASTELAVDLILGPLYWRAAIVRTPIAPAYLDSLADAVVVSLGGRVRTEP
ncbi:TetR family transcriptional regulator [Pilimelia anulata]|uniref:TetR family transcriptional regulator n=1 Tax=Pilimelia anulata TaxID=53371 RepID=A0A8J3FBV2_9ACTN|nr:TetR/AcrR family transcriptional regulator [Pilimelia anulata]GGJ97631.1 TetR family transcriptional regulator [Pilimelia anulata]